MKNEFKGFSVKTCLGRSGCPNRVTNSEDIKNKLIKILSKRDLKKFLKARVKGPLKLHHEFKISISDCPNACSKPQIVDIGIIGASCPVLKTDTCSKCMACIEVCRETALTLEDTNYEITIDYSKCLYCGKCIKICPTGSLKQDILGYRILAGGKLGRHPKLGIELNGIYTMDEALKKINIILDYYQKHNPAGKRLGDILDQIGI